MTVHDPGTLRIRCPADLLSAVSYLLGFHPSDSLVAVALRGTRVIFAARVDLPEPGTPHAEVQDGVGYLAQILAEQSPTTAVLVGYGPPEQVTPVVNIAEAAFAARGMPIGYALRVTGGRYFPYHFFAAVAVSGPPGVSVLRNQRLLVWSVSDGCVSFPSPSPSPSPSAGISMVRGWGCGGLPGPAPSVGMPRCPGAARVPRAGRLAGTRPASGRRSAPR